MKRTLSLIMSLLMILTLFSVASSAGLWEDFNLGMVTDERWDDCYPRSGDFEYFFNQDGSHRITAYVGKNEKVVVPNKIAGEKVKNVYLDNYDSNNLYDIEELIFSNGIEDITCRFYKDTDEYVNKLEKVVIPKSVVEIRQDSFTHCTLLDTIEGGGNVIYWGRDIFKNSLIYDKNYSKKEHAFYYKDVLMSVDRDFVGDFKIKEGTKYIADCAFENIEGLKSIYIPKSLKPISDKSYSGTTFCNVYNCPNLEKITVSKDNKYLTSVNGILFSKDKTTIYRYPSARQGNSYTIPKNVNRIMACAFEGSKNLTSVSFALDSKASIGEFAFVNCMSMKSITIPKNVVILGKSCGAGMYSDDTSFDKSGFYQNIEGFVFKYYSPNRTAKNNAEHFRNSVTYCKDGTTKHKLVDVKAKKSTVLECGYKAHKKCSVCGEKFGYEEIMKLSLDEYVKDLYVTGGTGYVTIEYTPSKNATDYIYQYSIGDSKRVVGIFPKSKSGTYKLTGLPAGKLELLIAPAAQDGDKRAVSTVWSHGSATVKPCTHKYTTVTTKATAKRDGKVETVCSVCGKVTKTAPIYKVSTITTAKSCAYTGKALKPAVTVKDSKGKTLKSGTDYTVTYKNNTNFGKASAVITLKGKYSGTKTLSFNILPANVKNFKATQTTTTLTLSWSKVSGADAYRVYKYNAKTKKWGKLDDVKGTTVTYKNLKPGTSYKFAVKAFGKSGKTYYSSASYPQLATATKPSAPTLKSTTLCRSAKLSWNKVANATGYVVYMSTSEKGKYTKVVNAKSNLSYTKKDMKKGTYYFKVAAYKTVEGKNIYSPLSNVKSVKVK